MLRGPVSRRAAKHVQGGVASNTGLEDRCSYSAALVALLDVIQHDWRAEEEIGIG